MIWPNATAAFLLALLGGLHCAAMCGGFVGALHAGAKVPVVPPGAAHRDRLVRGVVRREHLLIAGYHAGRVTSYVLAGGLAGIVGGGLFASRVLPLQVALLIAGSVMLLAIAATMVGRGRWLKRIEPAGLAVWKRIAPLARRLYPPRTVPQSLAAGLAWGWIPCGMVYAALPLALTAGDARGGMLVMLAFGVGTLPNLLGLGFALQHAQRAARARGGATLSSALRAVAAATLVVFGLSGLAHAAQVAGAKHPAIVAVASLCHR